jgi:hypothetical protein
VAEIIANNNSIKISKQTISNYQNKNSEEFILKKMQIISKKYKIRFSGIYHYYEEFLNGSEKDRTELTIIYSVTNAIVKD